VIPALLLAVAANVSAGLADPSRPAGETFTIGAYYSMPQLEPKDNFSWDYAFMDMARIGCNRIVVGGSCWPDGWAAIRNWGMKGITSYHWLNSYPGEGKWDRSTLEGLNRVQKRDVDNLVWGGKSVGGTIIGHIVTDEPECDASTITGDQIEFLRVWSDVYHEMNPGRDAWVNHCDPPWYDFNENQASCSAAPTIAPNSSRIIERRKAAREIGLDHFTVVALQGRLSDWGANRCDRIEGWSLGPCSEAVFDWLDSRTNQEDAYEMMITAYAWGSPGFHPYQFNKHRGYSIVDIDGNDNAGIRAGFSAAAHDLRRAHGWPGVELFHAGQPFDDRGRYPAGDLALTAEAVSDSGTIAKVIFGKSTNGGSNWEATEDDTAPYSATFPAEAGQTVIFRARAVDSEGRKSIFSANMIHVK
jgi:hypothetical protein